MPRVRHVEVQAPAAEVARAAAVYFAEEASLEVLEADARHVSLARGPLAVRVDIEPADGDRSCLVTIQADGLDDVVDAFIDTVRPGTRYERPRYMGYDMEKQRRASERQPAGPSSYQAKSTGQGGERVP